MDGDEYSSECEEQPQETMEAPATKKKQTGIRTVPVEEIQPVEPKKKRNISEAARATMMANLAKAREALKQKKDKEAKARRISQYPKQKRDRAKEMMEQEIQREADRKLRLLAEETLRKKKEEQEFLEFKKWKESSKIETPPSSPKKPKSKPKPKKKPAQPAADRKTKQKAENSGQPAEQDGVAEPWFFSNRMSSFNIDDYIG